MIVSASRYEDIPAFRGYIIDNFLDTGIKEYTNYKKEPASLNLSDVDGFVFWTKNIFPFINTLSRIKDFGIPFYIHHTFTNYNNNLEPYLNNIESMRGIELCKRNNFDIIWRYDPIIITNNLTYKEHINNFKFLCSKFNGITTKCYFSFLTMYKKLEYIFEIKNINVINNIDDNKKLITEFSEIALEHNIAMYACANEYIFGKINKGHCIDPEFARKVGSDPKIIPTRKLCGCAKSIDIGYYNMCNHGCIYCYANSQTKTIDLNENNIQ